MTLVIKSRLKTKYVLKDAFRNKIRHWKNAIEYNLGIVKLYISLALFISLHQDIISDLPHLIAHSKKSSKHLEKSHHLSAKQMQHCFNNTLPPNEVLGTTGREDFPLHCSRETRLPESVASQEV